MTRGPFKINYSDRSKKYGLPETKVLVDEKKILDVIEKFQANTKTFWGACVDSSLPAFSVGKVKQGYIDAKKRGIQIQYITDITKDNLKHCKEIMHFAEMRHMDCIAGNFAVSDTEYVAGVMRGNILVNLLYSDLRELVKQQRNVFDTLWRHSMPAEERLHHL